MFDPDDPVLTQEAPLEPAGLTRMHLSGWPSQLLVREFRLRGTKFMRQMEQARQQIAEATAKGRPIHNVLIPKEKT